MKIVHFFVPEESAVNKLNILQMMLISSIASNHPNLRVAIPTTNPPTYSIRKEIIEEMVLFRPDFVIFSSGFDAHDEDPLADCELSEEDYEWATRIGKNYIGLDFKS